MLVAADQSRLQPWVYEYALLLIVLGSAASSSDGQHTALKVCRSLLVALYFWGAVQKMNVSFVTRTWPEFVGIPARHALWLQSVGWAPPLVELGIALTLASRRLRRVGVAGAVLLHVTNIALLLVSGENSVVWVWNAAMAASVIVLFAGEDPPMPKASGRRLRLREWVVLALAWVMPALSFLGFWDSYLSAALYSGNTLQGVIVISQASITALPKVINRNTLRLPRFGGQFRAWVPKSFSGGLGGRAPQTQGPTETRSAPRLTPHVRPPRRGVQTRPD